MQRPASRVKCFHDNGSMFLWVCWARERLHVMANVSEIYSLWVSPLRPSSCEKQVKKCMRLILLLALVSRWPPERNHLHLFTWYNFSERVLDFLTFYFYAGVLCHSSAQLLRFKMMKTTVSRLNLYPCCGYVSSSKQKKLKQETRTHTLFLTFSHTLSHPSPCSHTQAYPHPNSLVTLHFCSVCPNGMSALQDALGRDCVGLVAKK